MSAIIYLIPISLILGALALAGFLWTLRRDQYEDPEGDAYRILIAEDAPLDQETHSDD